LLRPNIRFVDITKVAQDVVQIEKMYTKNWLFILFGQISEVCYGLCVARETPDLNHRGFSFFFFLNSAFISSDNWDGIHKTSLQYNFNYKSTIITISRLLTKKKANFLVQKVSFIIGEHIYNSLKSYIVIT
jgi:hypothetical protein